MLKYLENLVKSFDDDNGLPYDTYDATRNLVASVLGEKSATTFGRYVDAVNDRFFLKENTAIECWQDILADRDKG